MLHRITYLVYVFMFMNESELGSGADVIVIIGDSNAYALSVL